MVLVISMLLLVLAIIQMVIYYRFGINFFKPMNRHDRKRIKLRQKGIIQQKPTTNQKRQKHNNKSNSGCTPYDPKSDSGYMNISCSNSNRKRMMLLGRNIDNSFDIALSFSELCQDLEAMFLVGRSSVLVGAKLCS